MTNIEYLDADGVVTRTVTAPADEAEAGIHAGETSYRIVDAGLPMQPGAQQTIEAVREAGRSRIDGAAGRARARYLSTGPGQQLTYQAKYADACEYLRALQSEAPPTTADAWPYVFAEAAATGTTPEVAATRIAQIGAYWQAVIGPQIEAARVSGKDALAQLETIEAVATHITSVVGVLDFI